MESSNILVVEDDAAHAELISLAFEPDTEFDLRMTPCLRAARAAIAERSPELVITDLLLPDGRGIDLLPAAGRPPEFPVVVMTGHGDEKMAVEAMKAGAVDYVVKSAQSLADLPRIATSTLREWDHIVERRKAEQALQASEERYRTLFENNPSMFFTVDARGTVVSVNRFAADHLGRGADEMVGRPLAEIHVPAEQAAIGRYLADCFRKPSILHRWDTCQERRDGTPIWVNVAARVVEYSDADPLALVVCEDVTATRQLSDHLVYNASHDPLTGLANRRQFERRLQQALSAARTEQAEHALCYLDLDQFKVINDTCGHVAGDELLRQLANLLKQTVRKHDTLARLGGDEFGVVLTSCPPADALRVADSLRKAVEDFRFLWENKSFNVGVSIGLVPIHEASGDSTALLAAADAACYAAKDRGRNRIHLYREDDAELARRHGEMQWVPRIHRALEEDRFRLVGQPIVSVTGHDRAHLEVLVRMVGEDGEDVLPGAFLAPAERYGLIHRIDRWVIDAAFEWLARRRGDLERLTLCSINLSGRSVGDRELCDFIVRRLEETGIPPGKICFEITETTAIANLSVATELITELKALGCRFALDDFGSGLSSFDYLKNLPVDFIKIDGMFVRDIADDPMDLALVKAIHEIGHVMGKETIAEFVENEHILKKLMRVGIDYAQGFYVGAPRPLEVLGDEILKSRGGMPTSARAARIRERPVPEVDPPVIAGAEHPAAGISSDPGGALFRPRSSAADFGGPDAYRILHVDDDPVIRAVTVAGLKRAGFEVWSAESGRQALDLMAERGLPHLALVDIFMPGMSGLELCRRIQASTDLPIIMVSSADDSETEVEAIRKLAEDFVTKPFELPVLAARIERLLRRIGSFDYAQGPRIRVDDHLEVELGRRRVHVDGRSVELTRIETKLLYILMGNAGKTVTTDFLLRRIWPHEEIYENVLRTHIGRLRKKIEKNSRRPRYLKTRRGMGYYFRD